MRVLVCGSRNWSDKQKIKERLEKLPEGTVIIHGACRGADQIAGEVARELGFQVIPFPADWKNLGRSAGPIRNAKMIEVGKPEYGIAFHQDYESSAGTKDCVRKMTAKGLTVELIK